MSKITLKKTGLTSDKLIKEKIELEKLMLNIDDIIEFGSVCYAHLSEDKLKKETLKEHTECCQKYWIKIARDKHIETVFLKFEDMYLGDITEEVKYIFELMSVNIVTMHDLGKINPKFQYCKMQNKWNLKYAPVNEIGSKHSIISSMFYLDYFLQIINEAKNDNKLTKEECDLLKDFVYIYSYIISRHHSDVDEFEEYLDGLAGKKSGDIADYAYKWYGMFKKEMYEQNLQKIRKNTNWLSRISLNNTDKDVYLYAWTRFLYSLLVAADYYATSEFMSGWENKDFGSVENVETIINNYEDNIIQKNIRSYEKNIYPLNNEELSKVNKDTFIGNVKGINILRTEMFLETEENLKKNLDSEILYIEAPTGIGKSNTAINLSFKIMQNSDYIRKIFYIYPFNTLVEQNMNVLEKVFGNNEDIMVNIAVVNSITPYKSNIKNDEECISENYQKILLDRQFLNYPMVLSTHIMLFETMFGNSKESTFGFHQLAHSVIVIDEIQSYNNKLWAEIINFLKAFAQLLDIKIIIMSATLPNLELLTANKGKAVKLITDSKKYFNHKMFSQRVTINYDLMDRKITFEELAEHILKSKNSVEDKSTENINGKKILVEFIKKSSAETFYKMMKELTDVPVRLMNGDSSLQERKKIIADIENMYEVIVVATQVVEAGVDIDMDIGYKDISRLDSEEQFMGRINRSGRRKGIVYFFNMDDAKKIYTNDVRTYNENTLLDKKIREMLSAKDFYKYYEKLILPVLKNSKEKYNDDNINTFFSQVVGKLNFKKVSEQMKLIKDRKMISVYFSRKVENVENPQDIIDGGQIWEEYKSLLTNNEMPYQERTVKLHNIRSKMNMFIYQFDANLQIEWDEQIGDIFYIANGIDYYDENGVLNKDLFMCNDTLFI